MLLMSQTQHMCGTKDPRMVYGFGGNLNYKQWDFSFFFQGSADAYRVIGGSDYFIPGSGQGVLGNVYDNYTDCWTEKNPSQDVVYQRVRIPIITVLLPGGRKI